MMKILNPYISYDEQREEGDVCINLLGSNGIWWFDDQHLKPKWSGSIICLFVNWELFFEIEMCVVQNAWKLLEHDPSLNGWI